jgi:single-strand DNA-binding protein
MGSLNKVQLIGRLGAKPEMKYLDSGKELATFSMATSERFKNSKGENQERTEWHKIVAFGRLAEICVEYLSKGSLVFIEGRLQTRSWEDKGGKTNYITEIVCLNLQMLDSKNSRAREEEPEDNNIAPEDAPVEEGSEEPDNSIDPMGEEVDEDGDSIPF